MILGPQTKTLMAKYKAEKPAGCLTKTKSFHSLPVQAVVSFIIFKVRWMRRSPRQGIERRILNHSFPMGRTRIQFQGNSFSWHIGHDHSLIAHWFFSSESNPLWFFFFTPFFFFSFFCSKNPIWLEAVSGKVGSNPKRLFQKFPS